MKSNNDRWAVIASFILAIASLVAAIYHTQSLLPLLDNGKHAEAVVAGIKSGARGSKMAIYRFYTDTGKEIISKDIFQMYIIRLHKGDTVPVIYDQDDPEIVTADLGIWTWQGTVIFLFGFIFLSALGVMILRYNPDRK